MQENLEKSLAKIDQAWHVELKTNQSDSDSSSSIVDNKKKKRDLKAQRKADKRLEKKERSAFKGWGDDEHQRFLEGVRIHGKNWKAITKHVGTRERSQVASHAQAFRKKVIANPDLDGSELVEILVGKETTKNPCSSKSSSKVCDDQIDEEEDENSE